MMRQLLRLPLLVVLLVTHQVGCKPKPSVNPNDSDAQVNHATGISHQICLRDATPKSGINFVHQTGADGRLFLAEAMTGGVAVFDYDNDGREDIYFCSGHSHSANMQSRSDSKVFFANRGGLAFRDVSSASGLANSGYCLGVTIGDYDNDGFADIYLSNWGPNQLLRNNGDGTFADVSCSVTTVGDRFGAGVCMADINQDGGLDLIVGNYVKVNRTDPAPKTIAPVRTTYPGPLDYPAETNTLLINNLDGTWTDAGSSSGLSNTSGTAMGIIMGDFDSDGDGDIYVANDEMANYLWLNDGKGSFSEVGFNLGVAVDSNSRANGSMGIDCADVDWDGLPDFVVTSYEGELVTLYQMKPDGSFEDKTQSSRLGKDTAPHVTWGCSFGDLDNDGDVDVYVASGHINTQSSNYKIPDLVFENKLTEQGTARFDLISSSSGDVSKIAESARGTAIGDLDNDGDLDVVVLNSGAPCTLLENTLEKKKNWIAIRLIGTRTNRSAIGAKVYYQSGSRTHWDEVRSGRGYQSYWGEQVFFGLGDQSNLGTLKIVWPDGSQQLIDSVSPNQVLQVIQTAPL